MYPGISGSGFNSYRKDTFINHGIGYMAAYLENAGYRAKYVDLRYLKDWSDFRRAIRNNNSEVYGISSTTVDFGWAIKCAKIIKRIWPKSKIVVGGVHATVSPRDALSIKEFDYVVSGEGEVAILELMRSIEKKRRHKRYITGVSCPLESIPHIDRDLAFHSQGEMMHPLSPDFETPFATFISSRGCPFVCSFCQPAERMVFGGRVRLRDMTDVVDEIVEVEKKYGLKSFLIHDDLFSISSERMDEFARLYKKTGIKAKFMCQARADLLIKYESSFKKLREVGLECVMVGFESGSQRVLDFINKRTTVEQNIQAGNICRKLGIKIWANYMLGIPTETYGEMVETLRMIARMKPEYYSPALFTPYPGTELYDYCRKNRLLIFKTYRQYKRGLLGDKIKGFNYQLIRFLIFWYMPWRMKWYFYYFLMSFWKKGQ